MSSLMCSLESTARMSPRCDPHILSWLCCSCLHGIVSWHSAVPHGAQVLEIFGTPRTGLFALLNEECIFPKGSDGSFVEKLIKVIHALVVCVLWVAGVEGGARGLCRQANERGREARRLRQEGGERAIL